MPRPPASSTTTTPRRSRRIPNVLLAADNPANPSSCTNFYGVRINPSNTGNVRIQSLWHLGENFILTFDPSYQYVLANGGGTTTIAETAPSPPRQCVRRSRARQFHGAGRRPEWRRRPARYRAFLYAEHDQHQSLRRHQLADLEPQRRPAPAPRRTPTTTRSIARPPSGVRWISATASLKTCSPVAKAIAPTPPTVTSSAAAIVTRSPSCYQYALEYRGSVPRRQAHRDAWPARAVLQARPQPVLLHAKRRQWQLGHHRCHGPRRVVHLARASDNDGERQRDLRSAGATLALRVHPAVQRGCRVRRRAAEPRPLLPSVGSAHVLRVVRGRPVGAAHRQSVCGGPQRGRNRNHPPDTGIGDDQVHRRRLAPQSSDQHCVAGAVPDRLHESHRVDLQLDLGLQRRSQRR